MCGVRGFREELEEDLDDQYMSITQLLPQPPQPGSYALKER